jgi:hypothetical protein
MVQVPQHITHNNADYAPIASQSEVNFKQPSFHQAMDPLEMRIQENSNREATTNYKEVTFNNKSQADQFGY